MKLGTQWSQKKGCYEVVFTPEALWICWIFFINLTFMTVNINKKIKILQNAVLSWFWCDKLGMQVSITTYMLGYV